MKIEEFDYTKKDGEKSHRKVMIVANHKDYIDAIDLDKLTEEEIRKVLEIQSEYESKLSPYMKKSFRRFSKDGMTEIQMEEIKNNG
jgi:predicted MPP superfamily phosphohydrolase